MRKTFSKAVVLAAMAAMFLTATAAAAETGTVTGSSLRIRQEPSTQSEALAQLNAGTQVQILTIWATGTRSAGAATPATSPPTT